MRFYTNTYMSRLLHYYIILPYSSIRKSLKIEPLHVHIEASARSAMFRQKHSSSLIEAHYTLRFNNSNLQARKPFKINIMSCDQWTSNSPVPKNTNFWYTDGSHCNNQIGAETYCPTKIVVFNSLKDVISIQFGICTGTKGIQTR